MHSASEADAECEFSNYNIQSKRANAIGTKLEQEHQLKVLDFNVKKNSEDKMKRLIERTSPSQERPHVGHYFRQQESPWLCHRVPLPQIL